MLFFNYDYHSCLVNSIGRINSHLAGGVVAESPHFLRAGPVKLLFLIYMAYNL